VQQRLSLVTLGVTDVARSRRFYERLGWQASPASVESTVFFALGGGMVLALWGRAELAADAGLADGGGFGGIALAYNTRTRAEVDALLESARAAGGRLLRPARDTEWGGYNGYFADPDGHPWEVAWNPHWTLREDGRIELPGS
jgi:predicted lactoylglutathione lyase